MSVPPAGERAYLDAATAAPLHPAARATLLAAYDEGWADPHRLYAESRRARLLLDAARESIAANVGCRADELTFTGASTAARRGAVRGLLAARPGPPSEHRVVASAVEHSAILQATDDVERVPVDRLGRVDVDAWTTALRGATAAALQAANHEVGTLQPVEAAKAAEDAGVPLVVDATPLLPWRAATGPWSVLVGGAEAWGGTPGVGLLAVRKRTRWRPPPGGMAADEGALPAVLASAAALEAVRADQQQAPRLSALVDRIRSEVPRLIGDVEVVGEPVARLPHVVTFSCLYVDGEPLLSELDRRGFAVGSGSACTSDVLEPSHVLAAMGVLTHGNIRLSLHPGVTDGDIDRLLAVLPEVIAQVRRSMGAEGL